jgi:two-component system sensor histidine kinase/response regulator
MMTFERSSLSQKLTSIAALSTATALLLVLAAFAVGSVLKHRHDEGMQLITFAGVIGPNSIDALVFKDQKQAQQALAALSAKSDIAAAALFDRHGKLFARYIAEGQDEAALNVRLPADGAPPAANTVWTTHMRVLHPLTHNDAVIGTVLIDADLTTMWIDILKAMGTMGGAMLGAMLVAMLMARRIKGSIVDPITKLISAAQKVSGSQNYTLRITHQRSDELGQLIDSFNDMLSQIEGRGNALANHRDELERQVSVRTEQLEKAKNAAEAASRAKSGFLATMSHEIRTPMNGVLGMTEMLLGTVLTEAQRNYTGMVKRSGEHLLVIINDILDFSKIEAGKLTIEYIHFNLWDLLDDIDHAFMPQVQAKGLAFGFDISPDIPIAVCGDPNRLRQVLANLLSNAVKFTDRGQVSVKGRVESEDAQSVTLRFEVHDTGIGISRDARQRIFDAFSQADNSTTRKYGGTGLGLAIARQLVELMGGKIGIDNGVTQGSIFWFTVSFDKRRIEPDEAGAPPSALEGSRALIVDEQASSRDALEHQLASWGVACDSEVSATSVQNRLQQAVKDGNCYDVAIIDMDLQRTSGLALAAAIKADPLTKSTRIVLLSSERCAADLVQRRQAGVAYQLIKPARAGDLFECMLVRPRGTLTAPVSVPIAPRKVSTQAKARRRKVLLAEDNPVNVEVAQAMLDSLGLDVQCAKNGAEALQAVQAGQFDAVLMDCQMPVMDGFAATAEIRRVELLQGQGRTLPVIAITANALAGDREACLAAGMDDYLSKPFTQQELGAVIARWIGVPLAATVHHDEAAANTIVEPAAASPAAIVNRDIINHGALAHIRALSKDRGDALVHKVIHAFVDDTPQHLRTLHQAIVGSDANNMRKAAHSLKSSSANVGADHLAQLCKEMETLGRTDSTVGASGILTTMEQEFQAVRHSLNAILEKET